MIRRITILILFLIPGWVQSQNKSKAPCSSPEYNQFDFWIGDWQLTYNDTMKAANHILKELDGCVIVENFNDTGQQFNGKSWSVFNPSLHQWQQTWVDNQGGYIVLTGVFESERMTLSTAPKKMPDGTVSQKRMIYYNISKSSFDWTWEATSDSGKTWKPAWQIHYTRIP